MSLITYYDFSQRLRNYKFIIAKMDEHNIFLMLEMYGKMADDVWKKTSLLYFHRFYQDGKH